MYQIEEPTYFYYLVILPILLVVFLLVSWWKKRTQQAFANKNLLTKLSPEKSSFKPILKLIMLLISLGFLIIALVNPKMGTKLKTVKREGVDIVFALDVSKSMLAEDIAPSRLEKSKQLISKIIDKLGSDRVGIIIYAGNAYPLLPITTDHASAKMFLQNAAPNMVSSQGTAINEALEKAITFYDNEEETNKFLIVVSDGEDHEENTLEIAKKAAKQGIKMYTIGVGTNKGGKIPIKTNNITVRYKKNYKGETVITKLNETILKEIATVGNGTYFNGTKTKPTVNAIEKILTNAQKSEFETKQFSDYKDQFQWFVGFGILFLLFDTFMFEKKTSWVQKLDLFNKKAKKQQ